MAAKRTAQGLTCAVFFCTDFVSRVHEQEEQAMNDELKQTLAALVEQHGIRRVLEEVTEVCWDMATAERRVETLAAPWRKIAARLGNLVHWQNLEYPS